MMCPHKCMAGWSLDMPKSPDCHQLWDALFHFGGPRSGAIQCVLSVNVWPRWTLLALGRHSVPPFCQGLGSPVNSMARLGRNVREGTLDGQADLAEHHTGVWQVSRHPSEHMPWERVKMVGVIFASEWKLSVVYSSTRHVHILFGRLHGRVQLGEEIASTSIWPMRWTRRVASSIRKYGMISRKQPEGTRRGTHSREKTLRYASFQQDRKSGSQRTSQPSSIPLPEGVAEGIEWRMLPFNYWVTLSPDLAYECYETEVPVHRHSVAMSLKNCVTVHGRIGIQHMLAESTPTQFS